MERGQRGQLWFPSLAEMPSTSLEGLMLVLKPNGMKISKNSHRSWEALKQGQGHLQKWHYTPFQLVRGYLLN